MFSFAVAVFFLIITPGPGVMTVAGVGSAFGSGPGMRYIAGLCVGTNLVALGVVTGIAAVVVANEQVRFGLLLASAAYLLYLAARIALSTTRVAFIESARPPGFMGGILLQAVNPKAYAVNTALFSGFNFLPESLMMETAMKFVVMNAIWAPIHFLWLYAGITLHRLNLPPRVQAAINVFMALSMLAVVGLALLAQ